MLSFNPNEHPYPSRRATVYANHGMVATSQPLAAQAGLHILRLGGNAIDAAIATAAALTVVEPTSNGIGSDNFAIVWADGRLHGLNSSGPAPLAISREALRDRGLTEIPRHGWIPVTVPGAPAGWAALSQRFGRLPLSTVLEPAIAYAEEGYPISPVLGKYWSSAFARFAAILKDPVFAPLFAVFAPHGGAPAIGEVWRSPGHAYALRRIAESDARDFYEGELADRIEQYARATGGFLRKSDLESFQPQWVDPVHVPYRGYDVWELPPNGQGIVALMALHIVSGFDLDERETVQTYHVSIEALKLAFADGLARIADPAHMTDQVADLLSPEYAADQRRRIGGEALEPAPGRLPSGGTVYLATADGEGNMVSFIQSNYMGFGSGVVVPGTGISLQNRGCGFSLDPAHPNRLEAGKRPYHTIIPGFLSKDGSPVGPFGVMGGFMQPQGHLQVIENAIDFNLNPQAALDAPRWQWTEGRTVLLEPGVPAHIAQALAARGHHVQIACDEGSFGRGEIIWRMPNGVLAGATEPRTDGMVAAW